MRRFLLPVVVAVLAIAVSGCGSKAQAGRIAAVQEITAGDKLLAAKNYDGAYNRYLKAANECTAGPVHDDADRKATTALTLKVGQEPLTQQVAAFADFLANQPDPILPLCAHNWLSQKLRDDAEAAVAHAKSVSTDTNKYIASITTPTKTAKKPAKTTTTKKTVAKTTTSKQTVAKKPGAKVTSGTVAARAATVTPVSAAKPATASAAATRSAAATAPAAPPYVMPSPADFKTVSQALPGLGQPAAMQKLYASLSEISSAMTACEQARAAIPARKTPTLAQRRTLTAADARLTRALQSVSSLLASL